MLEPLIQKVRFSKMVVEYIDVVGGNLIFSKGTSHIIYFLAREGTFGNAPQVTGNLK